MNSHRQRLSVSQISLDIATDHARAGKMVGRWETTDFTDKTDQIPAPMIETLSASASIAFLVAPPSTCTHRELPHITLREAIE